MNAVNITAVTPETVCIHGQTLAREYAETVLLGLLIASEGEKPCGHREGSRSVCCRRAES